VKGITTEKLLSVEIGIPPIREQHLVANILDTLDTQIQQTEALIAKLKQIKAGLLHNLLTRGIDENGEMRDPVEHPEEFKETSYGKLKIPVQWKIYPLQNIAEISSGVTLGRNLRGSDAVELPYLRVANVQDGYLDLKEMKTIRVPKHEVERYLLQPGDVLMTEGGDFDKLGRGTIWTGEIPICLHQNHIFKVRTDRRYLHPEFLALISRSSYGKHFFLLSSKQSTNLASINSTQLKGFPIPCPTKEEQERIIDVLSIHDARITTEESHLAKLKQIKKGLMDDLLTGRVRATELMASDECLSV
jgi:type I restriction enzyme S subunit